MADTFSAKYPLLVSREQAANAVRDFLRNHVGHGRRCSVQKLAEGTGIPVRRIECAMCDPETQKCDYRPLCPEHLLSLSVYFGTDFTSAFLSPAKQVSIPSDALDHSDVARACAAYLAAYTAARDPASESGVEIGPKEAANLDRLRPVIAA